ncbi:MAG: hypothetical protein AB7F32_09500 [Victivallaceae bacterium]
MERLPRAELSKVYGRSLIWLTAALAFAVFPGKNALWGEEGFFAEVVRESFVRGDLTKLTFNGAAVDSSAPLGFQLAGLFSRLFGFVGEAVLRLPSGLAALLALGGVIHLGRRLYPGYAGYLAGWLLLGSSGFLFWGRMASSAMGPVAVTALAAAWLMRENHHSLFSKYLVFFLLCVLGGAWGGFAAALLPPALALPLAFGGGQYKTELRTGFWFALLAGVSLYAGFLLWLVPGWDYQQLLPLLRRGTMLYGDYTAFPLRFFAELLRLGAPWVLLIIGGLAGMYSRRRKLRTRTMQLLRGMMLMAVVLFGSGAWSWEGMAPLLIPLSLLTSAAFTGDGRREWNTRIILVMRVIAITAGSAGIVSLLVWPFWERLFKFTPPILFSATLPIVGGVMLLILVLDERDNSRFAEFSGLGKDLAGTVVAATIGSIGIFSTVIPAWDTVRSSRPFLSSVRQTLHERGYHQIAFRGRQIEGRTLFYLESTHPVPNGNSIETIRTQINPNQRTAILGYDCDELFSEFGRQPDLKENYWKFESKTNKKLSVWLLEPKP